jgi:hypothetical protein
VPVSKYLLTLLLAMTIHEQSPWHFSVKTCRTCQWAGEPVTEMQRGESDDASMFLDGGSVAKMRRLEEEDDNEQLFGARCARKAAAEISRFNSKDTLKIRR